MKVGQRTSRLARPAENRLLAVVSNLPSKRIVRVRRQNIKGHKEHSIPRLKMNAASVGIADVTAPFVKGNLTVACDKVCHTDDRAVDLCVLHCELVKFAIILPMDDVYFPFVGIRAPFAPLYINPDI